MSTAPTRLARRGRSATAVALVMAYVTAMAPVAVSRSDPDDGHLLEIDARMLEGDAILDLAALAESDGAFTRSVELAVADGVRVLEVLDTHVLRVETVRGEEVVAVQGIHGTHATLPDEVNAFLRETAIPSLADELEGETFQEPGWSFLHAPTTLRDGEGRRLAVFLLRFDAEPGVLADTLLERGWACPAPSILPDAQLTPAHLSAALRTEEPAGLRALPAWRALCDELTRRSAPVLALTDDELTQRALSRIGELEPLLGWRPRARLRVEWATVTDMRDAVLARLELARASGGADSERIPLDDDELREYATKHARNALAWSPEGPLIQIRRDARNAIPDLEALDEVLVHELVHQYQEEVLGMHDGAPERRSMPWEGHAAAVTQRWLDARGAGRTHAAHELKTARFRSLLALTGLPPDDLLLRFRDPAWSDVGVDRLLVTPEPPEPQPVARIVPGEGPLVLRLSNPGDATLCGAYLGRWAALPSPGEAELVETVEASPPFRLVLPPGASVSVRLTVDALPGGAPEAVVRGVWYPVPPPLDDR